MQRRNSCMLHAHAAQCYEQTVKQCVAFNLRWTRLWSANTRRLSMLGAGPGSGP